MTPELTFIAKLFIAYADITTIPWVVVPVAVFIWSFMKSLTYYQDNSAFHTKIWDVLDRHTFRKIVVPLFSHIDKNLTSELSSDQELQQITDKSDFLNKLAQKKEQALSQRGFSYLETAIEFQDDVIEQLLRSKKNQITFKDLVKSSRTVLIFMTVLSALAIISGIVLIYTLKVLENDHLSCYVMLSYASMLCLAFISGAIFYYKRLGIEKLSHDEKIV
jgi:hypothetical protein